MRQGVSQLLEALQRHIDQPGDPENCLIDELQQYVVGFSSLVAHVTTTHGLYSFGSDAGNDEDTEELTELFNQQMHKKS